MAAVRKHWLKIWLVGLLVVAGWTLGQGFYRDLSATSNDETYEGLTGRKKAVMRYFEAGSTEPS